MNYYKTNVGYVATIGKLEFPQVTKEEYENELKKHEKRNEYQSIVHERKRPLNQDEVFNILAKAQINTIEVDDQTSLRMLDYYPTFEESIGKTVSLGYKFTYQGKVYKTIQDNLLIQEHYKPNDGTYSLYSRFDEVHVGDIYVPIPYEGNMALEKDKYYIQDNVTYLCNRDTVNPIYNPLNELVGLYVEVVEI